MVIVQNLIVRKEGKDITLQGMKGNHGEGRWYAIKRQQAWKVGNLRICSAHLLWRCNHTAINMGKVDGQFMLRE
jgi:hypothetical protein